jgi:hypothetical protein
MLHILLIIKDNSSYLWGGPGVIQKFLRCNKKIIILEPVSSTPILGGFNAAPKGLRFFFVESVAFAFYARRGSS